MVTSCVTIFMTAALKSNESGKFKTGCVFKCDNCEVVCNFLEIIDENI